MATPLPQIGEAAKVDTIFAELLAQPYGGAAREFERLLERGKPSDFERLLEREIVPKGAASGGGRGASVVISGARWIGYVGEGVQTVDVLITAFGDLQTEYEGSAEFEAALKKDFGERSEELAAAKKALREADLTALQDSLIEVDVMFRAGIRTLKQSNKKRRYRMVTGH